MGYCWECDSYRREIRRLADDVERVERDVVALERELRESEARVWQLEDELRRAT